MKSIALGLALLVLSFAPGCGESRARQFADAARPWWWDAAPTDSAEEAGPDLAGDDASAALDPDVPVEEPVDAAAAILEDAGLPVEEGDAAPIQSYQCGDGYVCLTNCENRCGLHELGRSSCQCQNGVLQCTGCHLTDWDRPQVPTVVSATCASDIASGTACSQVGDACFLRLDSPYPDGCLCWPTPTGLIWNCAPVFGWFTLPPDAGK